MQLSYLCRNGELIFLETEDPFYILTYSFTSLLFTLFINPLLVVGWNHPPIKLNKIDSINGVWTKPSHCRDSCHQVQRGIRSGLLSKHILYASNFQWSVSVIRHEEVNPQAVWQWNRCWNGFKIFEWSSITNL